MRRRSVWALSLAVGAAALPAVASAALLWTLVASPLTTTVNQSTTFTLTATNLDPLSELGCLEVDLSGTFVIESLGTPVASNGDSWASGQSGNAVIVHSLSGGGRLGLGETVRFTIRAHSTAAGTFLWPNHSHRQQDCSTADQAGLPLSVTVLPALVSTPSPTPTPTSTPTPTVTATPAPTLAPTATPSPILPILPVLPLPSIDLHLPIPSPTSTSTPTSRATATPEPSTTSAASDGSGVTGGGSGPGGGNTGGGAVSGGPTAPALQVGRGAEDGGADVEIGADLLGLLDVDVWLVPSALVAGPGLLVILWVLLQTIGAAAWIPAVRRMADEEGARRRPDRPVPG
jgi:hypothetical protein